MKRLGYELVRKGPDAREPGIEHIHADLKSGVLPIAAPKLPGMQPKKIAVKSAATKA